MKKFIITIAIALAAVNVTSAQIATEKVRCTAITKAGTQCKNKAQEGKTTCSVHTPVAEADRCKATTKAGTQCKRKHNDHSQYCTQHEKSHQ